MQRSAIDKSNRKWYILVFVSKRVYLEMYACMYVYQKYVVWKWGRTKKIVEAPLTDRV